MAISFDELIKEGITVTTSTGVAANVGIQLGKDDKTVIVTAPQGGYTQGENYILKVGTKVHSSTAKALKSEYKLHFNLQTLSLNY